MIAAISYWLAAVVMECVSLGIGWVFWCFIIKPKAIKFVDSRIIEFHSSMK